MMAEEVKFTVWVAPAAKPRMTQSDKWKRRPTVLRYRAFADELWLAARGMVDPAGDYGRLLVIAYLPIPQSWSLRKREEAKGKPHRKRKDASNILKAVEDALLKEDSGIWDTHLVKYWDDGRGPRVEVRLS